MKVLALLAFALAVASAIVVDSDITAAFASNQTVDVFVHFPFFDFSEVTIQRVMTRAEKRQLTHDVLVEHNAKYQPKLVKLLKTLGLKYRAFWIVNSVLVQNVNQEVFATLRAFPNVVELEANKDSAHIIDPMVHTTDDVAPQMADWNVEIINAPAAWSFTRGEGVTVANIDTGVRYTHEALRGNYRGANGDGTYSHDYNWHDPRFLSGAPSDTNGHGTHTMGTIAGAEATGVGVAPGSRWIAAKGCATSSCATNDLISSAEFVLCPTTVGGSNEDCSRGADLVSNSWGGGRGSTTFQAVIQAWVNAEIVPLFSQGNSGSSCSTANSPGDLGIVIGVGSTNRNDQLSSFSSRGPGIGTVTFPLQKPDISAPGEQVRSSYPTSDTAYASLSGTSMACPAAAGVVALMLSKNPSLTIAQVREVITKTCNTNFQPPNGGLTTCSGIAYTAVPNYHYGYGRVDALRAVSSV